MRRLINEFYATLANAFQSPLFTCRQLAIVYHCIVDYYISWGFWYFYVNCGWCWLVAWVFWRQLGN